MATTITYGTMSESEHTTQLRRAVVASTIGTAIEWYDFFIYGTAAGLIFGKLFFPNEDPLTGTLAAFGTYFIGFVGRPIGAAIFGHYGDRIGRKATLIATLLCMGIATFLVAFVPTYESIGIWGAVILTVLRDDSGHRRRRRMGRVGAAGDGVVAQSRGAWLDRVLAAVRRPLRAVPVEPGDPRDQLIVGRSVRHLGLARSIRALDHPRGRRPVDSPRHPRDAGVPEAAGQGQDRKGPDIGGHQEAAEGDHPLGSAADVRAGALLHLHRVRLCLCGRHAAHVARLHLDGGSRCLLSSRSSPSRCRATSPTASGARRCI